MTQSVKRHSIGRPVGSDNEKVRNALLEAARRLFLANEFKAVSIKRIAEAAGVNGAMVNYYFGGKKGLYLAMVEDVFAPMVIRLEQIKSQENQSVADFISSYSCLLAENPWWPNFVVREVLFGEGEMRDFILEKFASTMAPTLLQAVEREVAAGNFRADVRPDFTLMSLMGLSVFPFIAKPILEKVMGLCLDAETVSQLATHNTELFLHGVSAVKTVNEESQ